MSLNNLINYYFLGNWFEKCKFGFNILSYPFINNDILYNFIEKICGIKYISWLKEENKKEEFIYEIPKSNYIYRIEDIQNLNDKEGSIEI